MERAYKFKLYPKPEQVEALEDSLELCRRLYNAALEHRIAAYRSGQSVTYHAQQNELPAIKEEMPKYAGVHSQVLQQTLRRLDLAFQNFFRRVMEKRGGKNVKAGFPRFKAKGRFNSLAYPQSGFRLLPNGHLWLSRIGEVRMFMHRWPKGKTKTLCVKRSCGDWYAVFVVEKPDPPRRRVETLVGNDVGLRYLNAQSTGDRMPAPEFYRKAERRLKRANRRLSRTEKGSGGREKARVKLALAHRKVERQRNDFLHKLSRRLVDGADLNVFERLNIAGMARNPHLSKSIYDAAWGKFLGFTVYKAEEAGRLVAFVDPRGSSHECSNCGETKLTQLGKDVFQCLRCGLIMCRHVNAARVILSRVGRGTAEFTPPESGPTRLSASLLVERGSPSL